MAQDNFTIVSGLCVKSASVNSKDNKVKLVLEADKDDITAGVGTLADILVCLEFHLTGSDSFPVFLTLHNNQYEFKMENIKVNQDKVCIVLTSQSEGDNQATATGDVLFDIAYHSVSSTPVELRLASNQ